MNSFISLYKQYGLFRFVRFAAAEIYSRCWKYPALHSYSQCGEDVVLDRLLGGKKRGFYVDIGAYDPKRFSNTMRFYKRGWRGINIEPDPVRFGSFLPSRPGDTNLNLGIANKKGNLTYFVMEPATLSTFVQSQAREYVRRGFVLKENKQIPVLPLIDVLAKYAKKKHIDFLSLDVEGFEMEVLKSNDWKRFRPQLLCIETAVREKNKIDAFVGRNGFARVFDNGLNSIYKDIRHE